MTEASKPTGLTIAEATQRLNERMGDDPVSQEWVRRRITAGRLFAVKAGGAATAPWMIPEADVARLAETESHKRRVRRAGIVAGYGDDEFDAKVEQRHGRATMEQVRAIRERGELLAEMAREVRADADLHREFEKLDEDQAIEATAHAIAGRVRREERVQRRAAQILADDDDEHPA